MDLPAIVPNSSRPSKFDFPEGGEYKYTSTLKQGGFNNARAQLGGCHPVEQIEKNYEEFVDQTNFAMMKKIHGLHAPLRLMMERKAAIKVERLPFLPSSHFSLDVLQNKNETIGFEDILNDPAEAEMMGHPHDMVERQLKLNF